jgi:hypothetical protein
MPAVGLDNRVRIRWEFGHGNYAALGSLHWTARNLAALSFHPLNARKI